MYVMERSARVAQENPIGPYWWHIKKGPISHTRIQRVCKKKIVGCQRKERHVPYRNGRRYLTRSFMDPPHLATGAGAGMSLWLELGHHLRKDTNLLGHDMTTIVSR
ncbi:hypothetical protein EVAR_22182_1 [Eumeta japonica]|uniref:Uncharacterized protein n=1 Tax=Eumeta variegata TaxID=151549 RepID=A0A4C1XX94_EUMVA|nr:hypothetical protein EVAR_22182_1 [Eumeta japonica]